MPKEHGADGTYVETTPPERVFDVFDAVDGPVILSADVADTLECSRQTARRKLAELYDRGELDRRKISQRVIYWKPGETRDTALSTDNLQGDAETTLADLDGDGGGDGDKGG